MQLYHKTLIRKACNLNVLNYSLKYFRAYNDCHLILKAAFVSEHYLTAVKCEVSEMKGVNVTHPGVATATCELAAAVQYDTLSYGLNYQTSDLFARAVQKY